VVFLAAISSAYAENALNYDGKLGTTGIGMTLYTKESKDLLGAEHVVGKYFYNQYLKDIKIEGETDGKRGITLYEYDDKGNKVAVIKGSFPEKDPEGQFGASKLGSEVLIGTWSRLNGDNSLPFAVRMNGTTLSSPDGDSYSVAGVKDPIVFESKVRKFRSAVISGDRKMVAAQIRYPVLTSIKGKKLKIASSTQLLQNYAAIFTPRYVESIKKAVPHNMFCRYDGVMLGQVGEVWFDADGKVKTLNN
jgi:hypothetical protein